LGHRFVTAIRCSLGPGLAAPSNATVKGFFQTMPSGLPLHVIERAAAVLEIGGYPLSRQHLPPALAAANLARAPQALRDGEHFGVAGAPRGALQDLRRAAALL
jgi:hypothetical protein